MQTEKGGLNDLREQVLEYEKSITDFKTQVTNILSLDSELFSMFSQKMLETEKQLRSNNLAANHEFIETYAQVKKKKY